MLKTIFIIFGLFYVSCCSSVNLFPWSITAILGSFSTDQPISVLSEQNENNYIQFYSTQIKFTGQIQFTLPETISINGITSMTLFWNYRGSLASSIRWTMSVKAGSTWMAISDNTAAGDWIWTSLKSDFPMPPTSYFNNNTLTLQLTSAAIGENMFLDYLTILIYYTTPVPSPPTVPIETPPTTVPVATPPTNIPTGSPITIVPVGGSSWWTPQPGIQWQWQISSGMIDMSFDVPVYDVDLFLMTAATVSQLHGLGKKVICYFSAGSYEDWRPDVTAFPASILGNALCKTDSCNTLWPGERWLDVRQLSVLTTIIGARLDKAEAIGCDGVEPDNMDAYLNNPGFPISADDQIAYNKLIAKLAHDRNLSVGLKNDVDQIPQLVNDYDWALNEECYANGECDKLQPFIAAGKAVFGCEYSGDPATFCLQANTAQYSFILKNYLLDPPRVGCEQYKKRDVVEATSLVTKRSTLWIPTPGLSWQIQLEGSFDTSINVQVYFVDLFDVNTKMIRFLHSQQVHVICYFSAGTLENWRPDKDDFPPEVVGDVVPTASGERWLDISNIDVLVPLMRSRLDRAVSKGCDGVSFDDVDIWLNNPTPFNITYNHQLDYNVWISGEAHVRNLAAGFSNDIEQASELAQFFDFTVNEQCYEFDECDYLQNFTNALKTVFGIEYTHTMEYCTDSIARGWNHLKKYEDLGLYRIACNELATIEIQISGLRLSQSAEMEDEKGQVVASLIVPQGGLSDNPQLILTLTLRLDHPIINKRDVGQSYYQYTLTLSPANTLQNPITLCLTPNTNSTGACLLDQDMSCIANFTFENGLACAQVMQLGSVSADVPWRASPHPLVIEWVIPVCIAAGIIVMIAVIFGYWLKKYHKKKNSFIYGDL